MNIQFAHLTFTLLVLMLSCTNGKEETGNQNNEQDTIVHQVNPNLEIEKSIEKNLVIEQLQGQWKEIEYPFRTAEFVNTNVKFIEEGTEGNPAFEAYEIAENCTFENNNIKDLVSGDIILSLPDTRRCEKLRIASDTLSLSGFSTHTNENYNIIYLRVK